MNIIQDPWPYLILDDYVDTPVFEAVIQIAQEKIKIGEYGAWRLADERPDLYPLWEKKIRKEFFDIYLQFPKKRFMFFPKVLSHIVIIPPGFKNPIHFDRFYKILTSVTYVHPDSGDGTYIHTSKDSLIQKEIDWRPNRSLVFAGLKNKTWHSYENTTNQPRVTFVNTLTDKYVLGAFQFIQAHILKQDDRLMR